MKFSETCLYKTLLDPVDYIADNTIYYSVLRIPYFIINYSVGILMALVIDFYMAMGGAD